MTSFHDIYGRYAPDVFRFALHLSGNRQDAEDLTAETFVRLWLAKNVRMATVKAYLLAITRNLYLHQLRSRRSSVGLPEEIPDRSPNPEAAALSRDDGARLLAALRTLPETDRSALILSTVNGLSYREIATALGLTLANVKVKIHRGRLKVAQLLGREKTDES